MKIPDRLPTLDRLSHPPNDRKACAMEAASWLAGEEWSDHPRSVHPVVAAIARGVNDRMSDAGRARLWPLVLRSLATARPDDHVLAVRLVAWCARAGTGGRRPDRELGEAIDAVERWCDCPCDAHWLPAARRARAVERAAEHCVRDVARRSGRRGRDDALLALWSGLLDEWSRHAERLDAPDAGPAPRPPRAAL
jgi:hypothetical protein